jgi:hypothetical protein
MGDDMRALPIVMMGIVLATAGPARGSGGQILPPPGQSGRQIPGLPPPPGRPNSADPEPIDPHRAEQQEKARNMDRQKRLVADTEKLLALATDLKQQVDKTTKDTMSVDVIKKAEEIEKLARSVKERMKG